MQMKVLIADDEPLARDRLRQLLRTVPQVDLVAECGDGNDALESIQRHSPDLVFLDIKMPQKNGLEVIRSVGSSGLPVFIIVTAHSHFALPAFEVHAVDFLLKPFDQERFSAAVRWAREKVREARTQQSAVQKLKGSQSAPDRFLVRNGGRLLFVRRRDVEWIQSAGNYCELHVGPATHMLRVPLAALEQQLTGDNFIRVSRSVLVNQSCVEQVVAKSHGDRLVILKNGKRLVASRHWRNRTKLLSKAGNQDRVKQR